MNIKGPITVIIQGSQGSGKTQLANMIIEHLEAKSVSVARVAENQKVPDIGQRVTIIEKQIE